ncbi:hypothetical protein Baya_3924 [Bagarius yarrelli]|uniref:Uncharacterized protein n=1 Tax=Bagarius yarrelli TaxID=175774 RepID=A0A556TWZ3_BAGYA|nr:hypothetical protein Baya_3924 [Bagarius yarrelli]
MMARNGAEQAVTRTLCVQRHSLTENQMLTVVLFYNLLLHEIPNKQIIDTQLSGHVLLVLSFFRCGEEFEDEVVDEEEEMYQTVSESYSPPTRALEECDIKMEITSLELDEALCVTSDLPVRPHTDLLEKELVMVESADEDRHVIFSMWTNSIFR